LDAADVLANSLVYLFPTRPDHGPFALLLHQRGKSLTGPY
jgi:hypothetical protein